MHSEICRRSFAATALAVAALVLLGCAQHIQPIYNVQHHPIPATAQKLDPAEIGKFIVLAGAQHHWKMEPVAPGQINADYTSQNHEVHVAIKYSQSSYSINFVSAVNMDQKGGEIHHKYNEWVRTLETGIEDAFTKVGYG
jgi:hypothetical protein